MAHQCEAKDPHARALRRAADRARNGAATLRRYAAAVLRHGWHVVDCLRRRETSLTHLLRSRSRAPRPELPGALGVAVGRRPVRPELVALGCPTQRVEIVIAELTPILRETAYAANSRVALEYERGAV